jgi:hypothetical protein
MTFCTECSHVFVLQGAVVHYEPCPRTAQGDKVVSSFNGGPAARAEDFFMSKYGGDGQDFTAA